jgi:hypothetical protein
MKIIYTLFTAIILLLPMSAFSEEHEEGDPGQEMTKIIQCMATNLTLSHLHLQVAASILTLTAPNGTTLKSIAKGYQDLSKDEKDRNKAFEEMAVEIFIPQIIAAGETQEEINKVSSKIMTKILTDITKNIANPTYGLDEKIAMEKVLLEKSAECDAHFEKLLKRHTF